MLKPPTGEKSIPSIGSPTGGSLPPVATRFEKRLLVMGVVALVMVIGGAIRGCPQATTGVVMQPVAVPVTPDRQPLVASMPALPDAVAIAQARTVVEQDALRGSIPSLLGGLGGEALAWAERLTAEDRDRPKMPQRITAEDLVTNQVARGQLLIVRGRLAEIAEAPIEGREEAAYRWMSIALEDGQWLLALVSPDGPDLILNQEIQALGRYLGRSELPADGGPQDTDILFARDVTPIGPESESTGDAAFQGALRVPDDLYADVDDELPLVETRPYYITLGQIKLEMGSPGSFAEAIDVNRRGNDLHQDPTAFRGKPCQVRGLVYRAWEDRQVAMDRPYDVRRVVRVQIYRSDWGPITENGVTTNKPVLRIFELAAITDQPLPKTGDYIGAVGRFLKWRAIPVNTHPEMDRLAGVKDRQSGNVYTMLIVTGPWHLEAIETINWTPVTILLSVLAAIFVLGVLLFLQRDRGAEKRLQASVVRLRKARRELGKRQPVSQEGKAPEGATPPVTDPPPST